MSFLTKEQEAEIKSKLVTDETKLRAGYKARKEEYHTISVSHSLAEEHEKQGWEAFRYLKTKTKLRKQKKHSEKFEDDVWCQFYNLGYRRLNFDESFYLPFSKDAKDTKQIDVIAINDETAFLIECKSSEKQKPMSYKDEFDLLKFRLDGFKKSIQQMFGRHIKVKHIFATRNIRLKQDGIDLERLNSANSFYYDDNTYDYINGLIKQYKEAAIFQFLALTLRGTSINKDKINIPAVKGNMGGKEYYMFSIEPDLLLKIGFVLHRVRANVAHFPTYQRLLNPNRLKGIRKFINNDGFFPNSVIINFNIKKVIFEPSAKLDSSNSCFGTLKLPNSYAIAYIIDGQHRIYGYAGTNYAKTNTVPVVAFHNMKTEQQLRIFMDINENQKAVSPSLKLDLEEDLFWKSERIDSRLKALRSSIVKELSNNVASPLYKKIDVGEDRAMLKFNPFVKALSKSGLLPSAKGNKYDEKTINTALYNTANHDHDEEMHKSKKRISDFLILCYEFIEQNHSDIYLKNKKENFIISERGTYAFIVLIGSLNIFLIETQILRLQSSAQERFNAVKKYLDSLLLGIRNLSNEKKQEILGWYGRYDDWAKFFQLIVNEAMPEYNPKDLIDWKERQDKDLQQKGTEYSDFIESYIKKTILETLKILYGNQWDVEIAGVRMKCTDRALKEQEYNYKNNLGSEEVDWTGMFHITDYKSIIEKHWSRRPQQENENFKSFQQIFAYDDGGDFNNKSDEIRWLSKFNKYRNTRTHGATKEKKLNKEEIEYLKKIYYHFKL